MQQPSPSQSTQPVPASPVMTRPRATFLFSQSERQQQMVQQPQLQLPSSAVSQQHPTTPPFTSTTNMTSSITPMLIAPLPDRPVPMRQKSAHSTITPPSQQQVKEKEKEQKEQQQKEEVSILRKLELLNSAASEKEQQVPSTVTSPPSSIMLSPSPIAPSPSPSLLSPSPTSPSSTSTTTISPPTAATPSGPIDYSLYSSSTPLPKRRWNDSISPRDTDFLSLSTWLDRCFVPSSTQTYASYLSGGSSYPSLSELERSHLRDVFLLTLIYHSTPYSVLKMILDELLTPPPPTSAAQHAQFPKLFQTESDDESEEMTTGGSAGANSGGVQRKKHRILSKQQQDEQSNPLRSTRSADVVIAKGGGKSSAGVTTNNNNKQTDVLNNNNNKEVPPATNSKRSSLQPTNDDPLLFSMTHHDLSTPLDSLSPRMNPSSIFTSHTVVGTPALGSGLEKDQTVLFQLSPALAGIKPVHISGGGNGSGNNSGASSARGSGISVVGSSVSTVSLPHSTRVSISSSNLSGTSSGMNSIQSSGISPAIGVTPNTARPTRSVPSPSNKQMMMNMNSVSSTGVGSTGSAHSNSSTPSSHSGTPKIGSHSNQHHQNHHAAAHLNKPTPYSTWFHRKMNVFLLLHHWLLSYPQDFCLVANAITASDTKQSQQQPQQQYRPLEELLYAILSPGVYPPEAWKSSGKDAKTESSTAATTTQQASKSHGNTPTSATPIISTNTTTTVTAASSAPFRLDSPGFDSTSSSTGGGDETSQPVTTSTSHPTTSTTASKHHLPHIPIFQHLLLSLFNSYESSRARYLGYIREIVPGTLIASGAEGGDLSIPGMMMRATSDPLSGGLNGPLSPYALAQHRAISSPTNSGNIIILPTNSNTSSTPWTRSWGAIAEKNLENEKVRRMLMDSIPTTSSSNYTNLNTPQRPFSPPPLLKSGATARMSVASPQFGSPGAPSSGASPSQTTAALAAIAQAHARFTTEFLSITPRAYAHAFTWLAIQRMEEIGAPMSEIEGGSGNAAASAMNSTHTPLHSDAYLRLFLSMSPVISRRQMKISNTCSCFVATTILNSPAEKRKQVVQMWLDIAEACMDVGAGTQQTPQNKPQGNVPPTPKSSANTSSSKYTPSINFMHVFEIIYGINHQSVYRLPAPQNPRASFLGGSGKSPLSSSSGSSNAATNALPLLHQKSFLNHSTWELYTKLTKLTSPTMNYKDYRSALSEAQMKCEEGKEREREWMESMMNTSNNTNSTSPSASPPPHLSPPTTITPFYIPYLGILLKDLVGLEEAGKPLAGVIGTDNQRDIIVVNEEDEAAEIEAAEEETRLSHSRSIRNSAAAALSASSGGGIGSMIAEEEDDGEDMLSLHNSSPDTPEDSVVPTGSLPWDDSFLVRPRRNATLGAAFLQPPNNSVGMIQSAAAKDMLQPVTSFAPIEKPPANTSTMQTQVSIAGRGVPISSGPSSHYQPAMSFSPPRGGYGMLSHSPTVVMHNTGRSVSTRTVLQFVRSPSTNTMDIEVEEGGEGEEREGSDEGESDDSQLQPQQDTDAIEAAIVGDNDNSSDDDTMLRTVSNKPVSPVQPIMSSGGSARTSIASRQQQQQQEKQQQAAAASTAAAAVASANAAVAEQNNAEAAGEKRRSLMLMLTEGESETTVTDTSTTTPLSTNNPAAATGGQATTSPSLTLDTSTPVAANEPFELLPVAVVPTSPTSAAAAPSSSATPSSTAIVAAPPKRVVSLLTAALPQRSGGGGALTSPTNASRQRPGVTPPSISDHFLLNYVKLSKIYLIVESTLRCRLSFPSVPIEEEEEERIAEMNQKNARLINSGQNNAAGGGGKIVILTQAQRYARPSATGAAFTQAVAQAMMSSQNQNRNSQSQSSAFTTFPHKSNSNTNLAAFATPSHSLNSTPSLSSPNSPVASSSQSNSRTASSNNGIVSASLQSNSFGSSTNTQMTMSNSNVSTAAISSSSATTPSSSTPSPLPFDRRLQHWLLSSMLTLTLKEESQLMERSYAIHPRKVRLG